VLNNSNRDISCAGSDIKDPAPDPFEFPDSHLPPIKVPPKAEKMVEEVIGRGNGVEEFSN
jgi:hypothetical protein